MTVEAPDFSDEQLQEICQAAHVIACECPARLVQLLNKVREFRSYTVSCKEQVPEGLETHVWLEEQVVRVEKMLSQILFEFMQQEELLDEQQQLDLEKLTRRSFEAAIRQQLGLNKNELA